MKRCPSCGSSRIKSDYKRGETYCQDCGLVIDDILFDFGPEWRAFEKDQIDKRERTGGLLRYAKLEKGLVTEINRYDRDIRGRAIPVERKAKFYRLRKWQKRASMATSLQRNLFTALPELDRMCSYLDIPYGTKEECAKLYRKCAADGLVRGRSIESMVAAVIYIVARQHHAPRTLEELEYVSGVGKKDIGRSYKKIIREFKLKIPVISTVDYVSRVAGKLGISGETTAKAIRILKRAEKLGITSGKAPLGVAVAAVYAAGRITRDKKIPEEIKGFERISENTIQRMYKELSKKAL